MFSYPRCPLTARVIRQSLQKTYSSNCGSQPNLAQVKILPRALSFDTRRSACTLISTTRKASVTTNRKQYAFREASSTASYLTTSRGPVPGSEPGVDTSDEDAVWPQSRKHIQVSPRSLKRPPSMLDCYQAELEIIVSDYGSRFLSRSV